MAELRDFIALLSDLYWAAGLFVVFGGLVLFLAELTKRHREGPRVQIVNIYVSNHGNPSGYPRTAEVDLPHMPALPGPLQPRQALPETAEAFEPPDDYQR